MFGRRADEERRSGTGHSPAGAAALPADGRLRVRHPGAPAPAEERFDAASAGVGVERSFPADTFELICSPVTIACLTGGSLAAEQFRRRELGCVIWSITPDAVEALTGSGGAAFIARHPDAIPEGIVPSTVFDAPVELEPLP